MKLRLLFSISHASEAQVRVLEFCMSFWELSELRQDSIRPSWTKRAVESETSKTPSTLQASSVLSHPFLDFCFLTRISSPHFLPSSCPTCSSFCIRHFELSSPLQKVIFLWAFSSFSLVMPVSHESEHVKRMTSQSPLIINLSRAGAAAERTGLGASVPAAADPGDSGRLNPHGLSRARLGQQKRGGARRMRAIGGPYAESGTDGLWLGCRCFGFKGTGPAGRRIGSRRRVGS